MDKSSRRTFLQSSLAAGVAIAANPWMASRGANDRIRIGIVGCGNRGRYIAGQVNKVVKARNAAITAVCDVWSPQRENMAAQVEKWSGARPKTFSRHQDLLGSGLVDAVVITTPDFAHCPVLVDASRAGVHAYCEKPLSRTFEQAREALQAVRASGIIVQVGTQRRSEGRFIGAARTLRKGVLGTISEIQTAWHDCNPRWARDYKNVKETDVDWKQFLMGQSDRPFDARRFRCWHLFHDYTNGTPGLLGSHLIDAALMMVGEGIPTSAVAHGGVYVWKDGREHCDTIECLWEYPGGFLMRFACRLGNNFRVPEVRIHGTAGTFDSSSWKITPAGASKQRRIKEELVTEKATGTNHVDNWLDCIRSGKTPNASIEYGFAHAVAAAMANEACLKGRRIEYDAKTMRIRDH